VSGTRGGEASPAGRLQRPSNGLPDGPGSFARPRIVREVDQQPVLPAHRPSYFALKNPGSGRV
jgi:hypothetical protein